jgi:Glycosyltransferase WbsX
MGQSYTSLLAEAEARARLAGHKGIYFVGGTHVDSSVVKVAGTSGYSAFSSYNYRGRADDSATSFEELDSAYQYVWDWIVKESSIPYIVPMTQGWDKRPWGGSRPNPLHDLSGGNLPGFERHLIAARKAMDANPAKTMKTGVICCWNEFGEGSFIEPTQQDRFGYLEKVRKVFGSP